MTPAEFALLAALMRRQGMVFSYEKLPEASGLRDLASASVYQHVKNIRKKLGSKGDLIETVYGVGHKFASK